MNVARCAFIAQRCVGVVSSPPGFEGAAPSTKRRMSCGVQILRTSRCTVPVSTFDRSGTVPRSQTMRTSPLRCAACTHDALVVLYRRRPRRRGGVQVRTAFRLIVRPLGHEGVTDTKPRGRGSYDCANSAPDLFAIVAPWRETAFEVDRSRKIANEHEGCANRHHRAAALV